jgi:hypothetical protein
VKKKKKKKKKKMMKEVVVQDLMELIKIMTKCRVWHIQIDVLSIRPMVVQLNLDKEKITCI